MNRDGAKAGRMDVWASTQQIMLKWYHNNLIIETIHKVLPPQVECWLLYTIHSRTLQDLWELIQLES
jgi:hypothetical protein